MEQLPEALAVTRQLEFQADRYACRQGYAADLRRALVAISVQNLGDLTPDWLYSLWHHTHPPIVERLAAIDAQAKKTQ